MTLHAQYTVYCEMSQIQTPEVKSGQAPMFLEDKLLCYMRSSVHILRWQEVKWLRTQWDTGCSVIISKCVCALSYTLAWRWVQCVKSGTRAHQEGFWLSMCRSRYHSAWRWSERWRLPHVQGFPSTGYDQRTDPQEEGTPVRRSGKTGKRRGLVKKKDILFL